MVLSWELGSLSSLEKPWMGRVDYALMSLYLCVNLRYVVEVVRSPLSVQGVCLT